MRWLAFIIFMLPLVSSAAEPLGRLFFTPQQRATLDNARGQKIKIDVEVEPETETPAPPGNHQCQRHDQAQRRPIHGLDK